MDAASFKAAFPEFSSTDDAKVTAAITAAGPFFNVVEWDDMYDRGLGFWVAHELTLNAKGAAGALAGAGASTLRQVGGVMIQESITAIASQMEDPYKRTIYGQRYAALARQVGIMAGPLAI